jgi:5'-nucleotidase
MSYPIERKLVVGVSSSALFDMSNANKIYERDGYEAYRKYQKKYRNRELKIGPAFPFIRRFLSINDAFREEQPVEVVLLSHNSPDTGIRVFNSIKEYGLPITRAAFTSGKQPHLYMKAFNISLFLTTNREDVSVAVSQGLPAGMVYTNEVYDDYNDRQLRIAFDFDGVLADDEAERVYMESGSLDEFERYESERRYQPLKAGLLQGFLKKIAYFQKLESKRVKQDPSYERILHTAIVTARSAPAHERAINTLSSWNVSVDELILLGGISKSRILEEMRPHLFIDDQKTHLDSSLINIPMVHLPFGVANEEKI